MVVKARALLEEVLARRKRLQEGTVIVINGDGPDAQSILQGELRPQPGRAQPPAAGNDDEQVMGAIRDKFAINRGGKRYRFTVQRDEQGLITGMDVEEK
jgi:hypothetical protein